MILNLVLAFLLGLLVSQWATYRMLGGWRRLHGYQPESGPDDPGHPPDAGSSIQARGQAGMKVPK